MLKLLAFPLLFLLFITLKEGQAAHRRSSFRRNSTVRQPRQRTFEDTPFRLPVRHGRSRHPFSSPNCGKIHPNDTEPKHGRGCFSRWTLGEALRVVSGRQRNRVELDQNTSGNRSSSNKRLYGADPVSPGQYPWTVLITLDASHACGSFENEDRCTGIIVGRRWVLTAAHCVIGQTFDDLRIWGGSSHPVRPSLRQYKIDAIVIHQCFWSVECARLADPDPDCDDWVNGTEHDIQWGQYDIAMVRVGDFVNPATGDFWVDEQGNVYEVNEACECIDEHAPMSCQETFFSNSDFVDLYVSGWGLMGHRDETGYLETPDWALRLQHKRMLMWGDTFVGAYDNTIIEFLSEIGNATCEGDSGAGIYGVSPLDHDWYYLGIVFGIDRKQTIPPHPLHPGEPERVFACANNVTGAVATAHPEIHEWIEHIKRMPPSLLVLCPEWSEIEGKMVFKKKPVRDCPNILD